MNKVVFGLLAAPFLVATIGFSKVDDVATTVICGVITFVCILGVIVAPPPER
jgi:hypothetical protein